MNANIAQKKSSGSGLTGIEKASVLMMSLDEEVASKIFALMTEDEIRQISQIMSNLGKVETQAVDLLMTEFTEEISSGKTIFGDIGNAKKLLTKALGADKVESILGEISGPIGKDTWDRLNNIDEELLSAFLKNEHPQTVALILSRMKASAASKILVSFSNEFAMNVISRMVNLEPVKREVISDIEKILQSEFMTSLSQGKKLDTYEQVAEIFNNFDRATEQKFFEMIEKDNAETAQRIRELMFTFDDIKKLDNTAIQTILRSADKQKLPIALKGANDEIKELFFKNMSERASKILKEDIASLGPVRIKDVDEAQMSIVQTTKTLADSGEIKIPDGDEEQERMIY
ncbi:MAG TPA: flagellar motor switch protein FliG [Alphaproteobacteria bacterium]|nr:flagellar motor switch protein FliG [Alphaproteobacteria bacterium]